MDTGREALAAASETAEVLDVWWEPAHEFTGAAVRGPAAEIYAALKPLGWNLQWPWTGSPN